MNMLNFIHVHLISSINQKYTECPDDLRFRNNRDLIELYRFLTALKCSPNLQITKFSHKLNPLSRK